MFSVCPSVWEWPATDLCANLFYSYEQTHFMLSRQHSIDFPQRLLRGWVLVDSKDTAREEIVRLVQCMAGRLLDVSTTSLLLTHSSRLFSMIISEQSAVV